MIAEAYVRVRAASCCRPTGRGSAVRWRSGKQSNIVHLTDGNSLYGSVTWSTEADVARPPRTVSSAWRREVASNGGRGEAPVRYVFRGGGCKAASKRSRFGGSTPSNGGFRCSGTTVSGPAWRWPGRCRAICFSCFPYRYWTVSWWRLHGQEKVACRTRLALLGERCLVEWS